jgi:hypothetical protein
MPPDLSNLKITDTAQGCRFAVKVVPGASRSRLVGSLGQALKVAVAAAPEKGAANKALLKLLAKHLDLRPAQIRILSGQTQARKQILILSLDAAQLRSRLP